MHNPVSIYHSEWTAEEIAMLRRLAGTMSGREIAPLVGHTRFATLYKIQRLELQGFKPGRQLFWTPERRERLRAMAQTHTLRQAAAEMRCTVKALRQAKLGMHLLFQCERPTAAPPKRMEWSAEQDRQVLEAAARGLRAAMRATGYTARQVRARMGELGGRIATEKEWRRKNTKPWWRPDELEQLRALVKAGATVDAIAARTGRTPRAVANKMSALRIPARYSPRPRTRPVVVMAKHGRMLRQVRREVGRIEYCPQCCAPVSDWEGHFERMGHRRPAA